MNLIEEKGYDTKLDHNLLSMNSMLPLLMISMSLFLMVSMSLF